VPQLRIREVQLDLRCSWLSPTSSSYLVLSSAIYGQFLRDSTQWKQKTNLNRRSMWIHVCNCYCPCFWFFGLFPWGLCLSVTVSENKSLWRQHVRNSGICEASPQLGSLFQFYWLWYISLPLPKSVTPAVATRYSVLLLLSISQHLLMYVYFSGPWQPITTGLELCWLYFGSKSGLCLARSKMVISSSVEGTNPLFLGHWRKTPINPTTEWHCLCHGMTWRSLESGNVWRTKTHASGVIGV